VPEAKAFGQPPLTVTAGVDTTALYSPVQAVLSFVQAWSE